MENKINVQAKVAKVKEEKSPGKLISKVMGFYEIYNSGKDGNPELVIKVKKDLKVRVRLLKVK